MPPADRRGTYRSRYEPDYSDSYSDSDSPYPTERRPRPRRKSTTHSIIDRVSRSIGRLGINRSPSRSRHQSPARHQHSYSHTGRRSVDAYYPPSPRPRNARHSSSYSLSPSTRSSRHDLSPGPSPDRRWKHAARSALDAAVVEALRVRKEPGKWTGGKGARVATAALGAAAVDAFVVAKDPDKHGKRKAVEAAIGGLLLNRVVNGPRKELRKGGQSRR